MGDSSETLVTVTKICPKMADPQSVGEDVEKLSAVCIASEDNKGCSHCRKEFLSKLNKLPYDPTASSIDLHTQNY